MTGYRLARELHAVPGTRNAVFIAHTGFGQMEDKRLSAESRFSHHLVKPAAIPNFQRALADSPNRGCKTGRAAVVQTTQTSCRVKNTQADSISRSPISTRGRSTLLPTGKPLTLPCDFRHGRFRQDARFRAFTLKWISRQASMDSHGSYCSFTYCDANLI